MRTLQEKYNAIQEGKFSKDQFLVEARMQHPNIVTRFNGYDDAVQILKNKGMISDVKIEEARLTKNSLTDYRYKPTNEMDKYPYEQILRGLRVELEVMEIYGTPTAEEYAKALAKVSKNLAKDSIFYTNQLAGVNPKVDQHDQMVDATAKNTVDTFNGMKKAELKEYDLIYYIDSDVIIHNIINEEIFPDNSNDIVCIEHFWEFKCTYPYEDNKKSLAYVDTLDPNFDPKYCQACFFGAKTDVFIKLSDDLKNNINIDLKNNIIAKWYDESHFNKYILNKSKKILNNSYNHPSSIPLDQNSNGIKLIHGNVHCSL